MTGTFWFLTLRAQAHFQNDGPGLSDPFWGPIWGPKWAILGSFALRCEESQEKNLQSG